MILNVVMKQKISLLTGLFLLFCCYAIGQTTIRGFVKDSSGQGMPGVSVQVKGTTAGTVTKEDGAYTIMAKDANISLEFTSIGYESQTIALNGRTTLDVVLVTTTGEMESVVVIGYGTQKKKDLTGSVATVSAADFANRPIVNAGEALQGKAAGVQVSSISGKPGVGLSVRIRGSSSISAGNDPLYVVDGIPMTDIAAINPNDIETISILKDAASASIYGTRAANGVVLITTKKGKTGQSRIDINTYYGSSVTTRKLKVLNAQQYQDYTTEVYGSKIVTDSMVAANDINWQDEVFRTGNQKSYQVGFSGGNEKTQHYLSLGYMDQEGMIRPATFDRINGRLNLTTKMNKWLTLTTNTLFSRTHDNDVIDNQGAAKGGVVIGAVVTAPTIPRYTANGQIGQDPQTGWENPLGAIEGTKVKNTKDRVIANLGGDITFMKGLVLQSRFGLDYKNNQKRYLRDPLLTQAGRDEKGSVNETNSTEWVWLSEQTLNYTHNRGQHHFTALAGWSAQDSHYDETYIAGSNFSTDYRHEDWERIFLLSTIKGAPTKNIDEWGLMSYFGRVTYDFAGKYLLQANMRVDQSSKFAPGNRTAAFPSISAGWRISEENFMRGVKAISDLKLRVGWGKNGNQEGLGSYEYLSRNSINSGTGNIVVSTIAPQSLTWEKTTQTNVGIDASFLNRRLSLTADFYVKNTKDVLVRIPLSAQIVPSILLNGGSMRNIGEEFAISSKNILKKDFSWTTDVNISFNQNTVRSIAGDVSYLTGFGNIYERGNAIILSKDRPLGQFYGYVAAGVDPATGDQLYRTRDGKAVAFGLTTPDDRQFLGNAQPKFIYGMTNSVSYKNFDLSVFLQGSQGNKIFNGVRLEAESMKDSRNQSSDVLRRWRKAGDITDMPGVSRASDNNTQISSRFLEDGSYLRFKTITLSYRIDPKVMEHIGFRSASIYVSAQNLFTITRYTGFDPEVSSFGATSNTEDNKNVSLGVDYGAYPQAKTFLVGLNIGL